jgi:hypothetical protein
VAGDDDIRGETVMTYLRRPAAAGQPGRTKAMTKSAWKRVALAALVLLAGATAGAQDDTKQAARRGASAAGARLDLDYGFVVERDGKESEVGVLTDARSGDRFHIRVRPRQTAYAYLFVSKDDKAFDIVLPSERGKTADAMVTRNEWNTLPDQDWLGFDKSRGVDRFYLVLSSAKVDEIEELFEKGKADSVDETWLLDLRSKIEGDGSTTRDRTAKQITLTHRRRGAGSATVFEAFTIRHK